MNRLSGVAVPVRGGAGGTGGSSWVDPVINRVTSAPPGAPTPGDRYIIAAVASGVWTGKENYIADWNGATWDFTAPVTGLTAYVDAETEYYSYNGAAWVMESFGPHKTTHENGGTDELSVAGLNGELADPQPPKAHASSHNAGGGDALAIDAVAGTGSLRTLGTAATAACAGNDGRLSDARAPTAHGASHTNGTDNVADMVGDSGAGGAHGLVPAPAIGDAAAGKFLKANGAWVAPTGTGDVVGPASATDSGPALFNGTTGKLLKDGGAAGTAFNKSFGVGVGDVCQGNDGRLSDSRPPTAHASSHNSGGGDAMAIDAVAGTGSLRTLGTAATAACAGNDSRLSDARTPTAHAASHKSGGGDAVKLDELAAPTDVTTLDATTGVHGLLPKLGGGSTNFLRADGTWAAPPGGGGGAVTLNEPAADNSAGTQAIFDSAIVGEAVAFPDLLYLKSDGKWWKSDADAAASMPGLRMALESKAADAACSMLVMGRVRDDDWAWTVGGLIYASTVAGGLTQTAPSGSGDIIQIVGIAYHADKMIFDPSPVTAELV